MRRWGSLLLVSASVLVGPIVTAAPAQAICISWLGSRCPTPTPTSPTTAPPITTPPPAPTPPAPVSTPTPPAGPSSASPAEAVNLFFDATNLARAAAGLPALGRREDVAALATPHRVDLVNQGG